MDRESQAVDPIVAAAASDTSLLQRQTPTNLSDSVYCVNYVQPRICRPRMVARSSVNSKRLSNTLSVVSIPGPEHTALMPSMQRMNRIPQYTQSTQPTGHEASIMGSKYRRPISSPLTTGSRGVDSNSFPASFYPVSVGGGAAGSVSSGANDERDQMLNIDDLLIRRNRPVSKVLSRDRHSSRSGQAPSPLMVGSFGGPTCVPPVISYQENAIQTRIEYPPSIERDEIKSEDVDSCTYGKLDVEEKYQKQAPARVEVVLIFVKIGQVDTVNERYQADIFLQARWREPLLDAIWNTQRSKKNWRTNPGIENPVMDLAPKRHFHTRNSGIGYH